MTECIKLEPCSIRECWDRVRPGLEQIKARWPASNTWRPEDIYAEVVGGDAVLYMTEDGFAICTIENDRWTGTSDLFIWIAYAHEPGGMLKKYWPSFIEVAKQFRIKKPMDILADVGGAVHRWPDFAKDVGVKRNRITEIASTHRLHLVP